MCRYEATATTGAAAEKNILFSTRFVPFQNLECSHPRECFRLILALSVSIHLVCVRLFTHSLLLLFPALHVCILLSIYGVVQFCVISSVCLSVNQARNMSLIKIAKWKSPVHAFTLGVGVCVSLNDCRHSMRSNTIFYFLVRICISETMRFSISRG